MKLLEQIDNVYIFQTRKKEDTATAIDKINDIIKDDMHYIGITSQTDLRINGRQDIIDRVHQLPDFNKFNLILAWKQS